MGVSHPRRENLLPWRLEMGGGGGGRGGMGGGSGGEEGSVKFCNYKKLYNTLQ